MPHPLSKTAVLIALVGVGVADQSILAEGPTTSPARTVAEIGKSIHDTQMALVPYFSDPTVFADPLRRAAESAKGLALLARLDEAFDELARARPGSAGSFRNAHAEILEYQAAFGEPSATAKLAAESQDPDAAAALQANISALKVRWLQATQDGQTQGKIVDDAEALGKRHPENMALTAALVKWAKTAQSPAIADRLLAAATTVMNNPASAMAVNAKREIEGDRKRKAMEGQPIVITGTTPQGEAFSTADYKGKVVLVDFWATWCGPCVAGLPDIKQVYAQYHAAGLEVIGVSNDYAADKLTAYVQQQQMPWVQLYDAKSAAKHEWNPITSDFSIIGIPHMFVIDREGRLLSSNARSSFRKLIADALSSKPIS